MQNVEYVSKPERNERQLCTGAWVMLCMFKRQLCKNRHG